MNNQNLRPRIHSELLNFVRPSAHSTFSPSSTDRWMACPFSVEYCKTVPEEPAGPWAYEGTLAHSVCEAVYRKEFFAIPIPHELQLELARFDAKNTGAAAEMYECAHAYSDIIETWMTDKTQIGEVIWFGEERGIPSIPDKGAFGTADFVIVGTKGAAVIDFKYGKGKNVKADTPQLRHYASGVARYLIDVPENYNIHAVVYQPRTDFAPKETSYTYQELLSFLDEIYGAILESEKKDIEPVEGSHCFWCPANRTKDPKHKCPAIKGKAEKVALENFAGFLGDMSAPIEKIGAPNIKRDEAMLKVIALAPLLSKIAESSIEEFTWRMNEGEYIKGLEWKTKNGNRKINAANDEEAAALIKGKCPNVNPWKEVKKIKSITEIEKEAGKNALDTITVRPVKKELKLMSDRTKEVLGDLCNYANLANYDGNIEE